ncbi:hypothetical protein JXL19_03600 [bacterium]|nr:hypothetical protein [bacterium]
MKKLLVLFLLLLPICIALIMNVSAKTESVTMKLTGEVVSVDETAQTISVKGQDSIVEFDVANAIFDKDYGIEVVQTGDIVDIEFEEKDGKKAATVIILKEGKQIPVPSSSVTDEPEK